MYPFDAEARWTNNEAGVSQALELCVKERRGCMERCAMGGEVWAALCGLDE